MWKKSESTEETRPQPVPVPPPQPVVAEANPVTHANEQALIGSTISIKGDLAGDEDLLIEGKLEGKIELHRHSITIGRNGNIKGDIYGKTITVEGTVEGNLYGEEQLIVRQSAVVCGNIVAPRVTLEDGSNFKGNIDMSPREKSAPVLVSDMPDIVNTN